MLARTIKSAEELGIKEETRRALITFLGMAERGELVHVPLHSLRLDQLNTCYAWLMGDHIGRVNMATWAVGEGCDTVMCIGGTTEALIKRPLDNEEVVVLQQLFYPHSVYASFETVTVSKMAAAVAQFLAHGNTVDPWEK